VDSLALVPAVASGPLPVTTDWIQALSAVATMLLTAVLVWATIRYARETKRMAGVMASEFRLRAAPFLVVTLKDRSIQGWTQCSLTLEVRNAGTYPVSVDQALLVLWTARGNLVRAFDLPVLHLSLGAGDQWRGSLPVPLETIPVEQRVGANATGQLEIHLQLRVRNQVGSTESLLAGPWRI
jgi:hypothetical protein